MVDQGMPSTPAAPEQERKEKTRIARRDARELVLNPDLL